LRKEANDNLSFYKFFTAPVGLSALTSSAMRWSSPLLFRDPCELTHLQKLPFSEADLLAEVLHQAAILILAKEHPRGLPGHSVMQAILRWRREGRFTTRDEIEVALKNIFVPIVDAYKETLNAIETDWLKLYRRTRVLNGVKTCDNLALWRQYGGMNRGLALEFAPRDEDATFQLNRNITYQQARLGIANMDDQVKNILGQHDIQVQGQFLDLMSIKSTAYAPEQELRFFHVMAEGQVSEAAKPDTWMTDIPFEKSALKSVCFGLKTTKKDRMAIASLVKKKYPHTSIRRVRFEPHSYELSLDTLHEGIASE